MVGRDASNDIIFAHEAISTVHAHLIEAESGDSFEIIDNNSTNGTRVNEEELPALQNQTLINLDQIEFGKVVRAIYLTPRGFYKFLQDLIRAGII
jgi:pSer/pThr/pTyr-binding forkhead associated (FHA) protein